MAILWMGKYWNGRYILDIKFCGDETAVARRYAEKITIQRHFLPRVRQSLLMAFVDRVRMPTYLLLLIMEDKVYAVSLEWREYQ